VVALLADGPESEAARQHSTEAAAALVAGATAGDPRLAQILRPDPDDAGPMTWTVACYQIGDLSPTTLRDFSHANEAVQAVARCRDGAHVAAELLASSASGLRWTAMIRTGELLHFQLPRTSTNGGAGAGGILDAAQDRWADALARWAAEADEPVDRPGPCQTEPLAAMPPELRLALGQILEVMQGLAVRVEDVASARDVRERLNLLEQRVLEIQLQLGVSSLAPGQLDLELVRLGAEAPVRRLWRPDVAARLLAPTPGRPAAPGSPHTGRLLGAVSRVTRGLAAARRRRARCSEVVARAVSGGSSFDRQVCAGLEAGSPEASGPAAAAQSAGLVVPGRTTPLTGWCADGPCSD
jgi:hypothetical protein